MDSSGILEYVHHDLNQEINAIGGRYVLTDEFRLPFSEREVLYLVGYALFDSTCCGFGGCRYALIQGFILEWKNKKDLDGKSITVVERITDSTDQKRIRDIINHKVTVNQINFM